jgi:hypothetical protein
MSKDAALPLSPGEAVSWAVRASRLNLFDATAGTRIEANFAAPAQIAPA